MSEDEEEVHLPIHTHRESIIGAVDLPDVKKSFGEKTITYWGSMVLNLNNNTGPGMVILPLVVQQAGWFTPIFAIFVTFILSSFAATMLCEAMQMIPGNRNFDLRFEFATTVQYYYGEKYYFLFQILYTISMQVTNIAAMIISAQVVDQLVGQMAGRQFAIDYETWPPAAITSKGCEHDADNPWMVHGKCSDPVFIISLGFVLVMVVCIPLGYMNLDDNMWFQWLGMVGMVVLTGEFMVEYILRFDGTDCYYYGANDTLCNSTLYPDAFTKNGFVRAPFFLLGGQSQVVGVAAFTYAYVVTIPSWVNEKKRGVSVNQTVWWSALAGGIIKVVIGLFAAWAYALTLPGGTDARPDSTDILSIMTLSEYNKVTAYSAYVWDIMTLVSGIPIAAIMVRYNLLSGKVCGPFWSFFWGVVAPWIVTAFCYETDLLTSICSWASVVVTGYVNFCVPCMLYRTAWKRKELEISQALTINDDYGYQANETTALLKLTQEEDENDEPIVHALPESIPWITFSTSSGRLRLVKLRKRVNKIATATFLTLFFGILSTGAIIQMIVATAQGQS